MFTLELPWLDNQPNISCIPESVYDLQVEGRRIRVLDVPGRDGILIHVANYPSQIRGCIAVGYSADTLMPSVGVSAVAMNDLIKYCTANQIKSLDIWQS